jgi:uncharacterized protein YbjT (DUF2867 family)
MNNERRVLVTGATGAQGGSVARRLLADGRFQVRCATRNPGSEKALALREAGAEVVETDMFDVESLKTAMTGCWGVFGVTNFWEHFAREEEQGRNLVDAVADSDVDYFVLSTLPSAEKLSGGTLDVPHFEIKARLEAYARSLDLNATYVHVAFYYENFLAFFPPQAMEDGTFAFGFPQGGTPLAAVSVEDLGGVVAPLFDRPEEFRGKVVGVVGDDRPAAEYAADMSRILGKTVVYNDVPREVFASFGFPGAEDLANMFEMNKLYIPERKVDLELSRSHHPEIKTFSAWLEANKDALLAVLTAPANA